MAAFPCDICGERTAVVAETNDLTSQADIVLLTWTLENTNDCVAVLNAAGTFLKPGGHVAIATGSRILVPFKKPLDTYVSSDRAPDTHSFRWSRNSLGNLLWATGFDVVWENHWMESDWMMLVGKYVNSGSGPDLSIQRKDDPSQVIDYFTRWHEHTMYLGSLQP